VLRVIGATDYKICTKFNRSKMSLEEIFREALQGILSSGKRDFLPVKTVRDRLPVLVRKQAGIESRQLGQKAVINALAPLLGDGFALYKKGNTQYLGVKLTVRDMVMQCLKKNPGISSKRLKNKLPVSQADYLDVINELLEEGIIICSKIYKDHVIAALYPENPCIKLEGSPSVDGKNLPTNPAEKISRFRKTYLKIGGGRPYVYIHEMRHVLKWPKDIFDQVLLELSQKDIIVLQGGDPSRLTDGERRDSFTDNLGYLRVTVSWRKML
jgi:hypothetical protein